MLYCCHCGKRIDEHKLEQISPTLNAEQEISSEVDVQYICPRCGHLIHKGLTEENSKELSRASHAQIQRANNSFARGMSFNGIGLITLIISIIFFILAHKPAKGYQLVTGCAEFYVFLVSLILVVILLGFGAYLTVIGAINKRHYSQLLKDLNNKTFVQ